jgi:hypothetical protein
MRSGLASAASWALAIVAGVALARGWQPWASVIGVFVFLAWMLLLAGFGSSAWQQRQRARHGSRSDR